MKKFTAIFLMAMVMFSASASLVKATSVTVTQTQLQAKQKLEAQKAELKRKEADRRARNAAYNAAIKKAQDERRTKIAAANKAYQEALKKAKQLLNPSKPVVVDNTKQKERDNKRLSDLKQLQTALELYYTDHNVYPVATNAILGSANFACLNNDGFKTLGCSMPYMGLIPSDPLPNQSYIYTTYDDAIRYTVSAVLESTIYGLSGGVTLSASGIAD